MVVLEVYCVWGGLHRQTLRLGPLPISHELPLSHILWAEASEDVPVMLSPPPDHPWPEPQHPPVTSPQSFGPSALPGRSSQEPFGRQPPLPRHGVPDHPGGSAKKLGPSWK